MKKYKKYCGKFNSIDFNYLREEIELPKNSKSLSENLLLLSK